MSVLDKREAAAEAKFALDEERAFMHNARTIKQLSLWAAGLMNMDSNQANNYALTQMTSVLDTETIIGTILRDLQNAGISVSKEQILEERDRLQHEMV